MLLVALCGRELGRKLF